MAMTAMAIGMVAAPVVGGIVGNIMSRGDKKRAEEAMKRAMAQFEGINIPDAEKMRLALETPEVQGIIQPYMQQAEQLAGTAMEDVQIDPRLRQAQMQALETLSRMGDEGLTAEDRAALNQARRQVAGDVQAQQASILQNLAQRGVAGGGQELAARLASSQAQADRGSQEADRIMAMAQQRMLQGISQAGQLGGQIRGQEYGEQSELARARDAIQQFNLQQRTGAQTANIGALNEAQLRNLMEQQRIHESGVGTRNVQQQYNKELLQRKFENEMALAQARANAAVGQAGMYQAQAKDTAGMWQGIGSGIGTAAGAGMLLNKQPATPTTPTDTQTWVGTSDQGKLGQSVKP